MRTLGYVRVSRVGKRKGDSFLGSELEREKARALAAAVSEAEWLRCWRAGRCARRGSCTGFADADQTRQVWARHKTAPARASQSAPGNGFVGVR